MENSSFSNDSADIGGGIENDATRHAYGHRQRLLQRPRPPGGTSGGGGWWRASPAYNVLAVSNSTFSNDARDLRAGGIAVHSGTATVQNSSFSNDSADIGGGIENDFQGTLTVTDSTFSNDSTAGGNERRRRRWQPIASYNVCSRPVTAPSPTTPRPSVVASITAARTGDGTKQHLYRKLGANRRRYPQPGGGGAVMVQNGAPSPETSPPTAAAFTSTATQ